MEIMKLQMPEVPLTSFASVSEACEYIKGLHVQRPPKPPKPSLPTGSSGEIRKYADEVEKWEKEIELYKISRKAAQEHDNLLNQMLEEYIKEEAGLNKYVPEKYRQKMWQCAWNHGHSCGYYEVYLELCNLVDIFL